MDERQNTTTIHRNNCVRLQNMVDKVADTGGVLLDGLARNRNIGLNPAVLDLVSADGTN